MRICVRPLTVPSSVAPWRGADVRNILDFEAHFPGAKVVKLEENYRSKKAILERRACPMRAR
jgi:superfamily I DNA/RNA helicase